MASAMGTMPSGEGSGGAHLLVLAQDLLPVRGSDTVPIPALTEPAVAHAFFAYRIPHLPEALASPHLSGGTERERLAEVLDRHVRLVTGLGHWRGVGFALRYLWEPDRNEILMSVVARVPLAYPTRTERAEQVAKQLSAILGSLDVPTEAVVGQDNILGCLMPIRHPAIVEVRQHEDVVSMRLSPAYIVYPFHPQATTLLRTFQSLVNEPTRCLISLYLQPTALYPPEQQEFADVARAAATMASIPFKGFTMQGNLTDPMAQHVARLYEEYAQRLTDPYLTLIQVASDQAATTMSIAQSLGAEVSRRERRIEGQESSFTPAEFDVVVPRDDGEMAAAEASLARVVLYPWGNQMVSPPKARLRYLADARVASAVFRFPVGMRGGIPGIKSRQNAPSFEVGARTTVAKPGDIVLGQHADGRGVATVTLDYLTHHTLVAGTIGYGKTTTCMNLLAQAWERGVPFLVIEPAKVEYRVLLRSPFGADVRVFTLGDETVSPFRLNPLEIMPGVKVESHISLIAACFQAALPQFGPLPSLIEEALHRVYDAHGWDTSDKGRAGENRLMPTLGELYAEIVYVIDQRGYSGETLDNVRAAASGRIGSLLKGSKGHMLNTRRSISIDELMTKPTVLELESLNKEEQALVTLFLLTMLREYCRTTRKTPGLHHLTLIEEAHRLISATEHVADRETSADTRAEAAQMVSDLLSEVRALGEGVIVADQIPVRLVQDTLKNTNIKIIHRLPGKGDRDAVGETMNMAPEQQDYIGKMVPGEAALFVEGYERPTFIFALDYRRTHGIPSRLDEDVVAEAMETFLASHRAAYLPFSACTFCRAQCRYRNRVSPLVYRQEGQAIFLEGRAELLDCMDSDAPEEGWAALAQACIDSVADINGNADAAYCFFAHAWQEDCTPELANALHEHLDMIVADE